VTLAHPEGYPLMRKCLDSAQRHAAGSGGSFRVVESMDEAFEGADAVYPKSWGPYALMRQRTEANRARDSRRMSEIEKEALAQNAKHRDWICDERRMALTRGGRALYMHCLPADIGSEVSPGVMARATVDVAREANWKVYVIMAALATAKLKDLARDLERIED
jgi:ornithine carbamoyltransferase